MVFVPERQAARLKRASRNRRAIIITSVGCALLAIAAIAVWRLNVRQQIQAVRHQRESMARRELDRYAKSLANFYSDVGRYPTEKEGLAALIKRPPALAGWQGPYVEGDFSVDPWGNDYVYLDFYDGAAYALWTYGPEGEAAGRYFLQVNSGSPAVNPTPQP
jgi:general secretion pathway protein G